MSRRTVLVAVVLSAGLGSGGVLRIATLVDGDEPDCSAVGYDVSPERVAVGSGGHLPVPSPSPVDGCG